jgi:hypothetical protein
VQAELYVASDKLAKVARFTLGDVDGRRQVTTMTLTDHLQKERSHRGALPVAHAKTLGDEWFNPAFLVRAESAAMKSPYRTSADFSRLLLLPAVGPAAGAGAADMPSTSPGPRARSPRGAACATTACSPPACR